jgi:hypothetical protein
LLGLILLEKDGRIWSARNLVVPWFSSFVLLLPNAAQQRLKQVLSWEFSNDHGNNDTELTSPTAIHA